MPRTKLGPLKKVKVQWFITPQQNEDILEDAFNRGISPSEMARKMIDFYYAHNEKVAPREVK